MFLLHILGVAPLIHSPLSGSYRTSYRMEVVTGLQAPPLGKRSLN